ncbi:putative GNAT family acetyltransferase [Thozetella sp. PMI_491]|nr:putative GNAT family acetyltransferase [Thozetella sp. PMI_491]
MSLQIRHAAAADIPAVARVAAAAFSPSTDAVARNLFPPHLQQEDQSGINGNYAWRICRKSATLSEAGSILLVVVDGSLPEEQAVVGYAIWDVPGDHPAPEGPPVPIDPEVAAAAQAALDTTALESLRREVNEGAKALLGDRGYKDAFHLDYIAVDPQHRRRGVGKLLLEWGMQKAAAAGKDCFLMSTPAGRPLYAAAGFEEIGRLDLFGVAHFSMIIKNDKKWSSK